METNRPRMRWFGPHPRHIDDDAHQWLELGVLEGHYALLRRGGADPSHWIPMAWPDYLGFTQWVRGGGGDLTGDPEAPITIHGMSQEVADGFVITLIDWAHFLDAVRDVDGGFVPVAASTEPVDALGRPLRDKPPRSNRT